MELDILIEDVRWQAVDLEALADRALHATLSHLGLDATVVEMSCLACDDARIARLNADFRDKPRPTNVLSWPTEDLAPDVPGGLPCKAQPGPDGTVSLGDIAIAYETCVREADAQGKPITAHVTHLLVHASLHLLGFDHINPADAHRMEKLEVEILGNLGVPDPY